MYDQRGSSAWTLPEIARVMQALVANESQTTHEREALQPSREWTANQLLVLALKRAQHLLVMRANVTAIDDLLAAYERIVERG